jgi:uncharacterized protein YjbI with pentapeptide repeats
MTESKNNMFDQPKEEQQPSDETKTEYREISEKELRQILEDHKNQYAEGERADLSRTNLSEVDLHGAYLSEAILDEAILVKAILSEADLSGAYFLEAYLSEVNLSEANISLAHLRKVDLKWANLSRANLRQADLSEADLREADLRGADLRGADLSEANLSWADLSEAILDENTLIKTRKVKGGEVGVNGIWAEGDSAALMTLSPPGNSMQGPNPEAIIESLKRSRRLHGFSMSLVGIIILITFLNLSEIKFPWAENVKVSPAQFGLLAMPMSIGLLALVISFMSDALKGARYLQDRQSVMSVGNFPWSLSKYASEAWIMKLLSCTTRLIMCFHPITYIFIIGIWQVFNPPIFIFLSIIVLTFSGWTFYISESFQKPLLFDRKTEEKQKDNIEKQTEAIKAQTQKISQLIEIFKPIQDQKSAKEKN